MVCLAAHAITLFEMNDHTVQFRIIIGEYPSDLDDCGILQR